jgi:hypothetical protein
VSPQYGPRLGQSLREFPDATLPDRQHVYRSHNPQFGAGYFNGTPGRFNLLGDLGTCYVADDVDTAVREKVRDAVLAQGVLPASMARAFVVSAILNAESFHCANVSDRGAARHGVTRMLLTMDDYDVPQQWASALHEAGFTGIRYASRYTSGPENSWALFGDQGEHPFGTVTAELPGVDACKRAGITVYETPNSTELDYV